jgi:phosphoglycolate phosphatase-like HAD superfamily hydrolase
MDTENVLPIMGIGIIAGFIFFMGTLSGEDNIKRQAIHTHNAHYVLNETNGTSVFTWN